MWCCSEFLHRRVSSNLSDFFAFQTGMPFDSKAQSRHVYFFGGIHVGHLTLCLLDHSPKK